MRKILLLSVLSFIIITTNGQSTTNSGANKNTYSGLGGGVKKKVKKERVKSDSTSTNTKDEDEKEGSEMPIGTPSTYFGFGLGINSYTGVIGFSINQRVHKKLFVQGGFGLSSWGMKASLGVRYDLRYSSGWSFGVGLSYCSGANGVKSEMELSDGTKQDVTYNALPTGTLNLKATKNWVFRNKSILYLDLGIAKGLRYEPYEVTDGSTLSENSKSALAMSSPGGLICAVGFMFGVNPKK